MNVCKQQFDLTLNQLKFLLIFEEISTINIGVPISVRQFLSGLVELPEISFHLVPHMINRR